MVKTKRKRDVMDEHAGSTTAPPTHGCMECKAQRPYTVEQFANGHIGWRCMVCGKILNLIPGKYREPDGLGSSEVPA
jgi:hypothetical protein